MSTVVIMTIIMNYLRRVARVTPRPAVKLLTSSTIAADWQRKRWQSDQASSKAPKGGDYYDDNTLEDYPCEIKFVVNLTENVRQKECREKSIEDLDVAKILRELKETKTKRFCLLSIMDYTRNG